MKEKLAGMNLRIRSSTAHRGQRFFQHLSEKGFHHFLHAACIGLTLPAPVMVAMKAGVEEVSQ